MTCFRSVILLCPVACLLAQTPPPNATPVPAPASIPAPAAQKAAPVVPPDRVVITVGELKITAAEYEAMVNALPAQYQATARGEGRRQFVEGLTHMLVLSEEGKRRKLDQDPSYKLKVAFENANILASMTADQLNKENKPADAEIRKYYDEHKDQMERVHALHVLVRMQGSPVAVKPGQKDLTDSEALEKAKELRKRIADGESFAEVAKKESDDSGAGTNNGDLGTFTRGQMVAAFEEGAFALKKGEVSQPVKTQFGYHIIKCEDRDYKSFEEARPELEQRLGPERARKALLEVEAKSGVKLDPEYFQLAAEK
jgi:peptidyl-prolyl cis-trans isomerase C